MSRNEATKAVNRYIAQLKKANYPFTEVYLFGSFARGTMHRDSDIDIAVVSPEVEKDSFEGKQKLWRFKRNADIRIEPHGFSPKDFEEEWRPMVHEIKTTGIRVYPKA